MAATSPMRDQTMDEILESIHRMISEGETASRAEPSIPEAAPQPALEDDGDADDATALPDLDADTDWIAAGVAAILEKSRTAEPALAAERGFVDGFSAGTEDLALGDAAEPKVESTMTEQQRAAPIAAMPIAAAPTPVAAPRPSASRPEAVRPVAEAAEEKAVSDNTSASVGQAFEQLSRTILSQNPRTLEDLVRDMMRPMVRSWLDQNLPRIAERMVKQEIERITRGER